MTEQELAVLARAAKQSRANRAIYADALEEAGKPEAAAFQRLLSERRCYYRVGDFSNRYTVYVVPMSMRKRWEATQQDFEPITRREALRLGWSRPREARRDGEQWYGGFCHDPYSGEVPITPAAALEDACAGTIHNAERVEDELAGWDAYHASMRGEDG